MRKKIKIIVATIFLFFAICFSSTFAANELESAGNGIRNVVGGAENVVEGAASGIGNMVKGGLDKAGTATKDAANTVTNGGNNANQGNNGTMTRSNNNGYTATRTSTTDANGTFMGMTTNTWIWMIVGLAGIGIVAMVWYYTRQDASRH